MRSKQELDELQHEINYRAYVNSSSMGTSSQKKLNKTLTEFIESNIDKRKQAKKGTHNDN